MKNENTKALNVLINKIQSLIDASISKLGRDKTFKTTVWGINEDNTYKISYLGQIYDVPNASGIQLSLGQTVWVKIPDNIFRNMYISDVPNAIISGSSSGGNTGGNSHSHSNKNVLDSITSALINTWNSVVNKAEQSYVETLDERIERIEELKDKEDIITTTERDLSNTYDGGLKINEIIGTSYQDGTPSIESKKDIVGVAENGSLTITVNNATSDESKSITIPLSSPLKMFDKIIKQDGVWGVLRGTATLILDGKNERLFTFNGYTVTNQYYYQVYREPIKYGNSEVRCSHLPYVDSREDFEHVNRIETDYIFFYIPKSKIANEDELNRWLQSNPIIVEYPKENTVFEPFSDELQIALNSFETYDGSTHIRTDSDIEPIISVDYGGTKTGSVILQSLLSKYNTGGDFQEHVNNNDIHIEDSERTNWDNAYAHSTSIHTIDQGGTGATTAKAAQYNILSGIEETDVALTDTAYAVFKYASASSTKGVLLYKKVSLFWDYIKSKLTGAISNVLTNNLTASRALISNSSGKIAVSDITSTELGYLDGVNSNIQTQLDSKVPNTRTINGKELSTDISLTASDIGAEAYGAANAAISSANAYTNLKIDALVGEGASTTLDTIGEISKAIEEHREVTDALNAAIGNKASASDLTSHTGNTTVHITSTERTNWNDANSKKHSHSNKTVLDNTTASFTTDEKTKLSGIASGAEVNQNAFSNVVVGSTTIAADSKTDTLTLVAGSNVTITPDATNDEVTIAATDTTYSNATTSVAGLMSTTDKAKVDSLTHQNLLLNSTAERTIKSAIETLSLSTYGKSILSIGDCDITVSFEAKTDEVTDIDFYPRTSAGAVSAYRKTVTLTTEWTTYTFVINIKADNYVSYTFRSNGSVASGGGSTTASVSIKNIVIQKNTPASRLSNTEDVGSSTQPVYFNSDGVPVATTYTLGKSVPSDAKFTDTTYTQASLGQFYGVCSTAEATTAKTVSFSTYELATGGVVAIKFTYAVPASSTLNINSKGAKPIYYKGAAITAGIIKAGDTATFIYNGTQYHLLTIDRGNSTTYTLDSFGITATATELNYTDGVTSNIQTQLNNKSASNHNHNDLYLNASGDTLSGKFVLDSNGGSGIGIYIGDGSSLYLGHNNTVSPGTTLGTASTETVIRSSGVNTLYHVVNSNKYTILDTNNYKNTVTPANIGAAESSHGTHVTFSTTAPVVAGTASVGSATTVARSDHKHPAQTSVTGSSGSCTGNSATATSASFSASTVTNSCLRNIQASTTDLAAGISSLTTGDIYIVYE